TFPATQTSARYTGQNGTTYAFYSVATDNVGHVQPTPAVQGTTQVDTVAPTSTVKSLPPTSKTKITLHWSGHDKGGSGIAFYDSYVRDGSGKCKLLVKHTTKPSFTFTGKAGHSYGFYSVDTDKVGNRQATPRKAQATTRITLPAPAALAGRMQVADL